MEKNNIGRIIVALLSMGLGIIYLLNPGWGVIELIPDNIPWVGNLDEAGATALVIWGLSLLRNPSSQPLDVTPDQITDQSRRS